MICIRHTFVFSEILWIIVMTNRLVEVRPFFMVLLYAFECSIKCFVPITSSNSTRRECDYTFHTHLLLSSKKRKKKISVSKEICAKRKSTTTTIQKKKKYSNSINSIEFTKLHEWRSTNIQLKQEKIFKYSRKMKWNLCCMENVNIPRIWFIFYCSRRICRLNERMAHFSTNLCHFWNKNYYYETIRKQRAKNSH